MKQHLTFEGPIMTGSVSTAWSQCGKPNCACKGSPPRPHGPYYRWTGTADGKRTTKTISAETARECERRIENYRRLQREVEKLAQAAMKSAPWRHASSKTASKKRAASRSRKDVGN
jgi:hypothetical protein